MPCSNPQSSLILLEESVPFCGRCTSSPQRLGRGALASFRAGREDIDEGRFEASGLPGKGLLNEFVVQIRAGSLDDRTEDRPLRLEGHRVWIAEVRNRLEGFRDEVRMHLRQLGKARMMIEDRLQVRDRVMKETNRPATRRKSGTDRPAFDTERVEAHGGRLVR